MRRWVRARVFTFCGACGREIGKGSPLLEIIVGAQRPTGAPLEEAIRPANWTRTKSRCEMCAEEKPPTDLPELERHAGIEPTQKVGRSRQFGGVAGMARDWKHIQSGGDR